MPARVFVEDVRPVVSAARYPARAVVGEHPPVSVTPHDRAYSTGGRISGSTACCSA